MQGSTVYEPNGWKPFFILRSVDGASMHHYSDVLNIVGIGMPTYKIICIKFSLRLSVSAVKSFFLTPHQ